VRGNAPRVLRQSLIPDPERAAIVRRIFKHYATGTFTKQEILRKATEWGPSNRRGQPLSSQAIGMLLRNSLYVGIIDVPEFGVRDQRGDFEPLIGEEIFYKAQAVLSGKVPVVAPLLKRRQDRPLRGSSDSLYQIKGRSCSSVEMTPSEFTSRPRF
jgi:hypothetical protein